MLNYCGLAVFNNDKLIGTLSANETLCQELLLNNFNYCSINLPSPFNEKETIDLQLSSLKDPQLSIKIINNIPYVNTKIYITAKVLSFNSSTNNTLTEDRLNTVKESLYKYLYTQFDSYFNTTSKKYNSDIAGIGRYAAKNFLTIPEWENYKWEENYKNCNFQTSIIISIKSGHLITNE